MSSPMARLAFSWLRKRHQFIYLSDDAVLLGEGWKSEVQEASETRKRPSSTLFVCLYAQADA